MIHDLLMTNELRIQQKNQKTIKDKHLHDSNQIPTLNRT